MNLIQLGAAALNQVPLDLEGNTRRILEVIAQAHEAKVGILCLPELCITGYGCEDMFHSPALHRGAWDQLRKIAEATRPGYPGSADGMVMAVGLPVSHRGAVFDCAAIVANGQVLGVVPKRSLAGDGIHYEPRWFKAWTHGMEDVYESPEGDIPFGDLIFECGGVRLGFEICEEAWVANRPGAHLAAVGVDVILNPSASHFAFGKFEVRKRFVTEGSRAFGAAYVYSNLLGNEAGRIIYDGGSLIASDGKIIRTGLRLSFSEVCLTTAWIDLELNRMNRARTGSYQPEFGPESGKVIRLELRFPSSDGASPLDGEMVSSTSWEEGRDLKFEEFFRVEALGLFDYMRKSRSSGYVVSLSGGVDSGVTAGLVSLGIRLACQELGIEEVKKRISYVAGVDRIRSADELVHRLLTCVYQGTTNSSRQTREAARAAARAFHAEFHEWEIDELVQGYHKLASEAIGRPLDWKTDDLTLQNIQARVRSPGVWMLANLKSAILLATSNRSEAAVGYATMDGDTSGGLSPIAGIDKAFLNRFIRWLQLNGPVGVGPVPELELITRMPPTAELRPSAQAQTDEKDLMPYEVLDFIERAAIRDKRSPEEVLFLLRGRFGPGSQALEPARYGESELILWVKRFFTLWSRNQWKRERYAPSFHLDDESLDPKTWCRFPILSGAYAHEIGELEAKSEGR